MWKMRWRITGQKVGDRWRKRGSWGVLRTDGNRTSGRGREWRLQGEREERGMTVKWVLVIFLYIFLPPPLRLVFHVGAVDCCGECAEGIGSVVLQRGKWKAVESSAEQGCKLLLFSQFFTSSLWFQHQRWPPSATLSTPSFIPLPHPLPFFLSFILFFSHFISHLPSFLYTNLLPSTSPYSLPSFLYSHSISPFQSRRSPCCIHLHSSNTLEVSVNGLDHYH